MVSGCMVRNYAPDIVQASLSWRKVTYTTFCRFLWPFVRFSRQALIMVWSVSNESFWKKIMKGFVLGTMYTLRNSHINPFETTCWLGGW